jgi:hypothetical protein
MKMHERFFKVRQVEAELSLAITQFMIKQDEKDALTINEWLQVLNNVSHGQLHNIIKIEIRHERHGDETTPGDVAGD